MLRPHGHMDFEYLSEVFSDHQITYMINVPTWVTSFFNYLNENGHTSAVKTLRSLCAGGMYIYTS